MADIKILNPDALGKPLGQYSHLTRVKASEFVFIAGQVGVDKDGKLTGSGDFDAQCVQTFANIEAALKSVGAGWGNIVQFTTYLVHSQDIPKFMAFRLREFPKMFAERRLSAQHAADDRPAGAGSRCWSKCRRSRRSNGLRIKQPNLSARILCGAGYAVVSPDFRRALLLPLA